MDPMRRDVTKTPGRKHTSAHFNAYTPIDTLSRSVHQVHEQCININTFNLFTSAIFKRAIIRLKIHLGDMSPRFRTCFGFEQSFLTQPTMPPIAECISARYVVCLLKNLFLFFGFIVAVMHMDNIIVFSIFRKPSVLRSELQNWWCGHVQTIWCRPQCFSDFKSGQSGIKICLQFGPGSGSGPLRRLLFGRWICPQQRKFNTAAKQHMMKPPWSWSSCTTAHLHQWSIKGGCHFLLVHRLFNSDYTEK